MILEKINKPNDIHRIPLEDFPRLAGEIRNFLIQSVSETGGHLASNLGVVELTMALHNVLSFPEDKLIWDVGHQSYTHKILTGRKNEFKSLRKEGGLSGFPKRQESCCDAFDTGHSSNSVSAGLGYVRARDILGERHHVVSVIGDGALTGGMAYEALNNAAELKTNFIIVLNDNNMSISRNVGGMSAYLSAIRTAEAYTGMKLSVTKTLEKVPRVGTAIVDTVRRTKSSIKQLIIPGMLFENMGLTYLGPVDGHNMRQMMKLFNEAKRVEGAVLVHVLTKKGQGYAPALKYPERFHGTGPFNIQTGKERAVKTGSTYTDVFSGTLTELGKKNSRITAITAAMPEGTGLESFRKSFPTRFFDVGIAEEHAVTFAAGLALGGMLPVVAVYSSFLQRAMDQILEDVCMQKLHVIFALDRAGLVGADGETHHGCFDLSYLSMMPNMTVMAPGDGEELRRMLEFAVDLEGPAAIRYPRGTAPSIPELGEEPLEYGKSQILSRGEGLALLGVGSMLQVCREVWQEEKNGGKNPTLVNVRFVKPLDTGLLDALAKDHSLLVTVEENVYSGGFGEHVSAYMEEHHPGVRVISAAVGDHFVPHGTVENQRARNGLSCESILRMIEECE
ncbi:MAG: 1-deoxy-D-xylulose-5-phosphate synthase [Clostridiales bacterium]|nr:1-deoxy-D-xylulose-5-phosphate synthase [Clostridiales bacterium]